jgi:xanthine dehydrogenase accessory factor
MPGASQSDDVVEYPMTCHSGGALEILIEPVLPAPRLTVVGETPVAETLVALARLLGYRAERLDHAERLSRVVEETAAPAFVVVASMGVDDEEALLTALGAGVPYVALVASPKRAAAVREKLALSGVGPDVLSRLNAPAGLDIGARSQEEIALSILAEITVQRATMMPEIASDASGEAIAAESAGEAIDPVCGMTVAIAGARHTTEFDGKTWYFCCAGCKARFEAEPSQYIAA